LAVQVCGIQPHPCWFVHAAASAMPEHAVGVPWHHALVTVQPQPQSSHEPRSVKVLQREPVPPQ
jgi:hypothetical protein